MLWLLYKISNFDKKVVDKPKNITYNKDTPMGAVPINKIIFKACSIKIDLAYSFFLIFVQFHSTILLHTLKYDVNAQIE